MQENAMGINTDSKTNTHQKSHFIKVTDSRNRKIRGLWKRNEKFYVQMWVKGEKSPRRIPLKATNLEEAKKEMVKVQNNRDEDDLPHRGIKPMFPDHCKRYIEFLRNGLVNQATPNKFHKAPGTIDLEELTLRQWVKHIGNVRIDRIAKPMVTSYIDYRLESGINPRTINIDVIILRNVLKKAQNDGYLKQLPTEGIKPLKWNPKRKELLTAKDIENLFTKAKASGKNGQQLYDFLRFLAYTGVRETEGLNMKWADVDFKNKRVTLHITKNRLSRTIEFNPKLETLLKEMKKTKAPDTAWVFPSPQRGKVDRPAKTFRESLLIARTAAKLPEVGFHHLRHYFASMCVMQGIDFMTIAAWLGHKDGGILVGKVYGHLLDEHRHEAAQKLKLG
jgi:integrase